MHFIIRCRRVYGLCSVVESFEIHSYALARMNFMKFIECINFIIECRRVYGLYSVVESFEIHSYALARMSFMKFIECINFRSECRNVCGLDSNLVSSLYVLEGVIIRESTISTSVRLFMSLKES